MISKYTQDFYVDKTVDQNSVANHVRDKIKALSSEKRWHIVIKLLHNKRSLDQNAYYWKVVMPIVCKWHFDSKGEIVSPKLLHDKLMKKVYVPWTIEIYNGEKVKIYASTTELSTTQFCDMVEHIQSDFASMGYDIPDPDPRLKTRPRSKSV